MTKIISLPDNMEYDPNSREAYLQYKADCWRNVAISLIEAIDNVESQIDKKDTKNLEVSRSMFFEVKKMFPYMEI